MYILVGTMILYVFLQKNGKFEAPFLLNNVNIGRRVHPITRAVENSDAGKASPPLPAVLNTSLPRQTTLVVCPSLPARDASHPNNDQIGTPLHYTAWQ